MTRRLLLLFPLLFGGCAPLPAPVQMPPDAETREALEAPGNIRATGLALASLAAQEAIFHTTQALLETAALVHNQAATVPAPPLVEAGRTTEHVIDLAAGKGLVRGLNLGTTATALTFAVRQEALDGGVRYHLSDMEGEVDGFAVRMPRLTFTYMAPAGPVASYALEVETEGFFVTPEAMSFELDDARVAFAYPLATEQLGHLTITSAASGRRLESTLLYRGGASMSEGVVSDPEGLVTHGVDTGAMMVRVRPL